MLHDQRSRSPLLTITSHSPGLPIRNASASSVLPMKGGPSDETEGCTRGSEDSFCTVPDLALLLDDMVLSSIRLKSAANQGCANNHVSSSRSLPPVSAAHKVATARDTQKHLPLMASQHRLSDVSEKQSSAQTEQNLAVHLHGGDVMPQHPPPMVIAWRQPSHYEHSSVSACVRGSRHAVDYGAKKVELTDASTSTDEAARPGAEDSSMYESLHSSYASLKADYVALQGQYESLCHRLEDVSSGCASASSAQASSADALHTRIQRLEASMAEMTREHRQRCSSIMTQIEQARSRISREVMQMAEAELHTTLQSITDDLGQLYRVTGVSRLGR